jgi:uncharacterized zinc-type alcohol dehydrogenase-like protein
MSTVKAYAAANASAPLQEIAIPRRAPLASDVEIEILFCGICHSDLHTARNEWEGTMYPVVPGHEIVGRVLQVGSAVRAFKTGDLVGVGCMVGADGTCAYCREGYENNCPNVVYTYNSADAHGGGFTYGGYSKRVVVDEHFVLRIPANLDLAGAAPLLCAGITTFSPMRRWGVRAGQRVGIVGLGGLGHMGVKFAHAFGAHTVVFTTSPNKHDDALRLGADEIIVSSESEAMLEHAGTFDFILDTVSAEHDVNAYLELLAPNSTMVLVGAPPKPLNVSAFSLLHGARNLARSNIGGIRETQEMLDFCGEHDITSDVEVIRMQDVNDAYERMLKSDVKYRFSIDMASLN